MLQRFACIKDLQKRWLARLRLCRSLALFAQSQLYRWLGVQSCQIPTTRALSATWSLNPARNWFDSLALRVAGEPHIAGGRLT